MDINPQRVRTAEFSTTRKGLDPDEVRNFLSEVADELERAQNQSTAMEARARAAVNRLQQLTDEADVSGEVAAPMSTATAAAGTMPTEAVPIVAATDTAPIVASVDESETISRTMLMAQRAADLTIAEAEAEAIRVRSEADETAAGLVEQAKNDARTAGESERGVVESEVNALIARRDFLESDVDHMEQFLVDQRTRLREAATTMIDIAERVPGGLGEVRRPLLSASDDDPLDEPQDATMAYERPLDDGGDDEAADAADAADDDDPAGDASRDAAEDRDDATPTTAPAPPPVMRLGFDDA